MLFGAGTSYAVTGHNEYTDYYSNGIYTGTVFEGFVIDSVTVGSDMFVIPGLGKRNQTL